MPLFAVAGSSPRSRRAQVARQLADIGTHRTDSMPAYQQALTSANHLDDAARVLISRLQDPSQRIDALMEVQHYAEFPLPPRSREIRRRGRPWSSGRTCAKQSTASGRPAAIR